MRRVAFGAGLAWALALAGCSRDLAEPEPRGWSNIAANALWDDGKAEFSLYTGTTMRYGEPRPTEARIIVVKEDLLNSTLVKSENGPNPGRTREVLKLVFVADFPTGTYSYHQTAITMLDRATLDVLKETMSHTESCGITWVRVGPQGGRWVHEAHSYWEGEADREQPFAWPGEEGLFWDALPVSLRPWIAGGAAPFEDKVWLLPTQISGHSPETNAEPVEATIQLAAADSLRVPAGRFTARRFDVTTPDGTDRFWFDTTFPHVLLRMETHAGRRLELRSTRWLDYWNHHANGDERLLK